MSVLLVSIATGDAYREYAIEMFASAYAFWPQASQLLFTDFPQYTQAHVRSIHTNPRGYPDETLYRYHTILKVEPSLREYDHIFWVDADMRFVAPVKNSDVESYGLVATLHPGYIGTKGTPETRPESWAYCPNNTVYYCGGFQGGKTEEYLAAAKKMAEGIDQDAKRGIKAVWNDESFWNKMLSIDSPSRVLSPSYCYPENYTGQWGWPADKFKPILVALNKSKRGNHWSQR